MTIRVDEIFQLNAENERLQGLLRSGGANRYWEGRWRDEAKENDRLRAALNTVISRHCNDPDVQAYELVEIASRGLASEQGV